MTRKRTPLAPSANPASPAPELDAHGFDPSEYKWLPARRKPRKDGWTPQRQRDFIAGLAGSGSLEFACMEVGMSRSSAHRLRRSPGAEQFSAAWDVALEDAVFVAETLPPGELPRWHRGEGDAEAGADINRMLDEKYDRMMRDLEEARQNPKNG